MNVIEMISAMFLSHMVAGTMDEMVFVLSHGGGCIDGLFSAALLVYYMGVQKRSVKLTFRDMEPTSHLLGEMDGKDVVMVDLVYFREYMEMVKEKAKSISILEHHRGTKDTVVQYDGLFDDNDCGVMLVYKHILCDSKIRTILEEGGKMLSRALVTVCVTIDAKDRFTLAWQSLEELKILHAVIANRVKTMDSTIEFIRELSNVTDKGYDKWKAQMMSEGKPLYQKELDFVASIASRAEEREITLADGTKLTIARVPLANRKEKAVFSQVGDKVCAETGFPCITTLTPDDDPTFWISSIITSPEVARSCGKTAADIAVGLGGKAAHTHCTGIRIMHDSGVF